VDERDDVMQYREVRIEWSECFNAASRTLNINASLTVDEMRDLVRELIYCPNCGKQVVE